MKSNTCQPQSLDDNKKLGEINIEWKMWLKAINMNTMSQHTYDVNGVYLQSNTVQNIVYTVYHDESTV